MITIENKHSIELRSEEGKILYNGKDYTTAVNIPNGVDYSMWREENVPDFIEMSD